MNDKDEIQKLLEETTRILKKSELDRQRKGSDFNIFQILGVSRKEVPTCRIICELINPQGSHGMGILFLKSFLRIVLKRDIFSDEECRVASVTKEETLPNGRRIDLYIRIGRRAFPIEVKLYAEDQECQCYEYYKFAKAHDPDTVIYYLTLDRHMPSTGSMKNLLIDRQLIPISFGNEVTEWLQECLENDAVIQNTTVHTLLEQFLDVINVMTGRNRKEISDKMQDLIVDSDMFKAANAIAAEMPAIKAKMMKRLFADIDERLESKGISPIYKDYEKRAKSYYEQKSSTWPSLNYALNQQKTLVLRIEVDYCLYYGVCNWNAAGNYNPHDYNTDIEKTVIQRVPAYAGQKSNVFYLWNYLPKSNKVDLRECNESYARLYSESKYQETLSEICKELEGFFTAWNACNIGE